MNALLLPLLTRNWWLILLRGVAAILFGVLAFLWPAITLVTLALLTGAYALTDGILALAAAFRGGGPGMSRGWLIFIGILGIIGGIGAFIFPGFTAFALVIFIGSWSIVRGIFEIVGAIQLRKEIKGEWLLILTGILSVVFGFFVWLLPGLGALAIVWTVAAYSIVYGVLLISLAFRVGRHRSRRSTAPPVSTPRPA
jgi:uncharacterized membrane protein HdeD (DUF308 family)